MKRKIISFILCTVLLVSTITILQGTVFAADISDKSIGLQDAIDIALKNNSELKLAKENITAAERRYKDAIDEYTDIRGKEWSSLYSLIENAKKEFLYPMQREYDLNNAKWDMENKIKDIKLRVVKCYYGILLTQQRLELQKSEINRVKGDYENKRKQLTLGNISELDLLSGKITVDEAEVRLKQLESEEKLSIMDLNNLLGYDINSNTKLKKEKIPELTYTINNLEEIKNNFISTAYSIKKLETEKRMADIERGILETYSRIEPNTELEAVEDRITNLGFNIRDEKMAIEYKIRSDYNNILNLSDNKVIKKLAYDKASKLLEIAKMKLKAGTINELALSSSLISCDNALNDYNQVLLDYYTAVEEYKDYIAK